MQIEASSFFNQGEWKPVDFEKFKELVLPVDDDELADMIKALENGQCILSVLGTLKFRAAPKQEEETNQQ